MKKLLLWLFAGAMVVGLTLGPVAPALAGGPPSHACEKIAKAHSNGFDAGEDGFDAGEDAAKCR